LPWTERPLHPALGVELTGLRVDETLTAADRAAILTMTETHGVVALREQAFSDPERCIAVAPMPTHSMSATSGPCA